MSASSLSRAPVLALLGLLSCNAVKDEAGHSSAPDTAAQPEDSDTTEAPGESDPTDSAPAGDSGNTPTTWDCTVLPSLADPEGGGGRVVITVRDATGLSGAALGGVPLTDFAIDDDTHVSGVPGAHAAGVVDVVVEGASAQTCAAGFEYWTPAQINGIDAYLDANKGVTESEGAVSAWLDQGPNARSFTQANPANRPTLSASAFGALPAIRFTPQQYVKLAATVDLTAGSSIFAVARWTAGTTEATGNQGNVPLTIVGDNTSAYGSFGARGGAVASNHYVGNAVTVERGEGLNDGVARLIGAAYDTSVVTKVFVGNHQVGLDDNSSTLIGANSYDTIGAGYPGADGWDGELGAVIVVSGVIDVEDRTKLDMWAQQRFGTPVSAPLDAWTRQTVGDLPTTPDEWYPRDGAQMVELASGRILMIGGWSPYDPWGNRTTNEVWASDDQGVTWELLLAHDPNPPTSGVGARFPPGHTVGVTTWNGRAVVIGTDPLSPPYLGEVWHESDDGATWTRVATDAPSAGRCLFMLGNLGDDLYLMGGQTNLYDSSSGLSDVWWSADGGVSWTELDPAPWAPRGMVYRPVEVDGQLILVGGGLYDDTEPVAYNGVYAFDGANWTEVLADGHGAFEASYYNALASASGRLWMFNGFTGIEELNRALFSDDGGLSWAEFEGGSGGNVSHADDAVGLTDRVLRVSGNLSERKVYAFIRVE